MKKELFGYLIEDILGSGSYGSVYKAYKEKSPNELYALKVISRAKHNAKLDTYMKREVDILRGLNDEHLIKLKDFITTEKNYCLVFEYCNGGDLVNYRKLKEGRIDPVLAHNILCQIIAGLDVLYTKKIMHRDIKPSNILVTYKNDINKPLIKIGDFSFARLVKESVEELTFSEDNQPMSIVGTPRYMAPEIHNREPYSFKTEVWSLGVSFYELICGSDCFPGETKGEIISSMSKGFYKIPKELGLSAECLDFLNNCIQMLPENRFKWKELKEHPYITKDKHEPFNLEEFIKLNPAVRGMQIEQDNNYIFNSNRRYRFFIRKSEVMKEENKTSDSDLMSVSEDSELKCSESIDINKKETDVMSIEKSCEIVILGEETEYVKVNNRIKEYAVVKYDIVNMTEKYFN